MHSERPGWPVLVGAVSNRSFLHAGGSGQKRGGPKPPPGGQGGADGGVGALLAPPGRSPTGVLLFWGAPTGGKSPLRGCRSRPRPPWGSSVEVLGGGSRGFAPVWGPWEPPSGPPWPWWGSVVAPMTRAAPPGGPSTAAPGPRGSTRGPIERLLGVHRVWDAVSRPPGGPFAPRRGPPTPRRGTPRPRRGTPRPCRGPPTPRRGTPAPRRGTPVGVGGRSLQEPRGQNGRKVQVLPSSRGAGEVPRHGAADRALTLAKKKFG